MWRYIKSYPLSIIFVLIVTYLSLSQPPKVIIPLFRNWDKVAHFCMYGGLSGIIWIELLMKRRREKKGKTYFINGAVIFPILFGGVMELCQHYFTRYRSGDWWDFLANMEGVVIATLIAWFILRPMMLKNTVFKKVE
jgi:VanZ family protein